MPLQTRQASEDVLAGLDVTRFFQDVMSSGDIYEFDTSARAFQVGPNSDLNDYTVWYMDQQGGPLQLLHLSVSVGNPWVGRLDALNAQEFPTTRLKGKILISTRDLVDPLFEPADYNAGFPDTLVRYPIKLDFMGYHAEPPALAPLRSDRVTPINYVSGANGENVWHILPYYGRRRGMFSLINHSAGAFEYDLIGIRLGVGDATSAGTPQRHAEVKLTGTPIAVPAGETRQTMVLGSLDGEFDLLVARLPGTGLADNPNISAELYVSDTE